jgi:hypothetical protein
MPQDTGMQRKHSSKSPLAWQAVENWVSLPASPVVVYPSMQEYSALPPNTTSTSSNFENKTLVGFPQVTGKHCSAAVFVPSELHPTVKVPEAVAAPLMVCPASHV